MLEVQSYRDMESFRQRMQAEAAGWPEAVQQGIRTLAISGIRDPLSDRPIPPERLSVNGTNLRETIDSEDQ